MQYQFDGERERRAEFAMPKRTKQMGGIEQRLRIFVEDYVYTYLYQYGRSGGGAEKLAALVGKYYELEGQRVLLFRAQYRRRERCRKAAQSDLATKHGNTSAGSCSNTLRG